MRNVSITLPYIIGGISFAVCFLLAVLSAIMVKYRTNHTHNRIRRIWFWVICLFSGIATFLINYFGWAIKIRVASKQSAFISHSCYATIAVILLFIVLGWVVSKIFKEKKVSSWF